MGASDFEDLKRHVGHKIVCVTYLNFIAEVINGKCQYQIWNDKHEHLGRIEKMRVGQWQSWCLFLNNDCYMSASCLDETREKIRSLNNNKIGAI